MHNVKSVFERNDERGQFVEIINEGKWEGIYHGVMKSGANLGGVYHLKTSAFMFLKTGLAKISMINVETGVEETFVLNAGFGAHFSVGHVNSVEFVEDSTFILLKSRKYDPNDTDSYRYSGSKH